MSPDPAGTIVSLGMMVFVALWVAAIYSWTQVIRHRRTGRSWWSPIWSTKDVEPEGHLYFRRFIILVVAGVATVLVTIVLDAVARGS